MHSFRDQAKPKLQGNVAAAAGDVKDENRNSGGDDDHDVNALFVYSWGVAWARVPRKNKANFWEKHGQNSIIFFLEKCITLYTDNLRVPHLFLQNLYQVL